MKRLFGGLVVLLAAGVMAVSPAQAQGEDEKTFQVTLTPGVGIPTGDLGDIAEAGFAIGATGNYFLSEKVSIELNIDYFFLNIDEIDTSGVPSGVTVDTDSSGSMWGITGGGRYWFTGDRDWTPYVNAAAGFYFWDIESTATVTVAGTSATTGVDADGTDFGVNIGAGVDWALGENFAVGPVVRYHHIFGDIDGGEFQIAAALSYLF